MQPERSATIDHYLETIYCIAAEGEVVRPSRLAYRLSVSPPTVSQTLRRLERDGWITVASDRSIELTAQGNETATELVRHHRVLERWLTDVLGFDWAAADAEADRLTSAVSAAVIDRIDASMGRPATCPHGNVIPGRPSPYGALVSLADLEPTTLATIRRISEVAEHEARPFLSLLARHGISEGCDVTLSEDAPSADVLSVVVGDNLLTIPVEAAKLVWVEAL